MQHGQRDNHRDKAGGIGPVGARQSQASHGQSAQGRPDDGRATPHGGVQSNGAGQVAAWHQGRYQGLAAGRVQCANGPVERAEQVDLPHLDSPARDHHALAGRAEDLEGLGVLDHSAPVEAVGQGAAKQRAGDKRQRGKQPLQA